MSGLLAKLSYWAGRLSIWAANKCRQWRQP